MASLLKDRFNCAPYVTARPPVTVPRSAARGGRDRKLAIGLGVSGAILLIGLLAIAYYIETHKNGVENDYLN